MARVLSTASGIFRVSGAMRVRPSFFGATLAERGTLGQGRAVYSPLSFLEQRRKQRGTILLRAAVFPEPASGSPHAVGAPKMAPPALVEGSIKTPGLRITARAVSSRGFLGGPCQARQTLPNLLKIRARPC